MQSAKQSRWDGRGAIGAGGEGLAVALEGGDITVQVRGTGVLLVVYKGGVLAINASKDKAGFRVVCHCHNLGGIGRGQGQGR